jgi:hypothetical protein
MPICAPTYRFASTSIRPTEPNRASRAASSSGSWKPSSETETSTHGTESDPSSSARQAGAAGFEL